MRIFLKLITFPVAVLLLGILLLDLLILKPVLAVWEINMRVSSSAKDNGTREEHIFTVTKNN